MHTTSVSLLQRLRDRAEPADWQRFTDLYTPLLYYWARRLHLQESDAADLVQDVFVRLIQKFPGYTYDGGQSFRGWLHTVLLNVWRTKQRQRTIATVGAGEDFAALAEPDAVDILSEQEYRRYLAQRALRLMQTQFQPTTWRACWLLVVEGKSGAEVARELGISEGAAYVAKWRVLRRLREELEGLLA
jgi:RNA polymerase sigma-70 factor (ECF subfamily)